MFAVFKRYAVKGYLAATSVLLLSLVIVISISMMVEDNLLSRPDISVLTLIEVLTLRAISYGYQLIPIAAFLGVLVWGALTAKRGELTALYVGGYSTWQIGRPLIGTAFIMALLTLFVGEIVIPWSTNRLIALRGLDSYISQQQFVQEQWFKDGSYILYLPAVNSDTQELIDVRIFQQDENSMIIDWFAAKSMTYHQELSPNERWQLRDVHHFAITPSGQIKSEKLDSTSLPLVVIPNDLLDRSGRPSQLGSKELKASIGRRQRTGRVIRYHLYEYHQRLVYPLSLLILVMISIPMALKPDKNRSISGAIGSGTIVAAWAYGVNYLCRSMMSSGNLDPLWASWGSLLIIFVGASLAYFLIKRLFN